MDNSLQGTLQKLIENQATSDELDLLRQAFASGQIFIGGNVQNSVIIVGSGNTVQLNPELLERLAATNYLSALHQLPQPPADFVGRNKELKKILANIEKKGGTAISGLIGMAGIGKTSLGLIVAHALVNKYSDAQFFVDLRGTRSDPVKPIEAMKQIVQAFHPAADLHNATEEELSKTYRSCLKGKKTILFLDNMQDTSQVMPLRPPADSLLLVTSRWHFTIPGLYSVKLDILNQSDAIRLLREICPRLTRQDAQQISSLCGNLPIALRLAGSYLQIHNDWSAKEYILELMDRTKRLQVLQPDGAEAGVEASFEHSYMQLGDDEKRYWSMLAIFPASYKRDALAEVWGLDNDTARRVAGKMHQYSLLEYDSITNRYRLHDLLADYARTKLMESDLPSAMLKYFKHYSQVWKTAEATYTKGGDSVQPGLTLFDAESIHIKNAYEWAIANTQTIQGASVILKDVPDTTGLSVLRLPSNLRLNWFQAMLTAAQEHADLHNEIEALGNIGNTYIDLCDWKKAIDVLEKTQDLARKINDRKREGFCIGTLGVAYENLGDPRKAIQQYEQAIAISAEFGDKKARGVWLGNLGGAYSRLSDWPKSIEYYEQALQIARDIGNRHSEGDCLDSIGNAYTHLGQWQKGIEFYEQALVIAREIGDRDSQAFIAQHLGICYGNLGNPRKGIEYMEQALELSRELGDRQSECAHLGNIGVALTYLGEWRKAIGYYEQALSIAREIGDRSAEGSWLGSTGECYSVLGEVHQSINLYEQALGIARETGDRYRECLWLINIGATYVNMGECRKSLNYFDKGLIISREIGARQLEGACLGTMGEAYCGLNDWNTARECFEKALGIARDIGDRHYTGYWLGNIGIAFTSLEKPMEGIDYFEQALAIAREIGHRQLEGNWLGHIGAAYIKLVEWDKSSSHLEQALTLAKELSDPAHESEWHQKLGELYLTTGDIAQAKDHFESSLALAKKSHLRLIEGTSLFYLAKAYQLEQNKESALHNAQEARSIFESIESPKLAEVNQFIESLKV